MVIIGPSRNITWKFSCQSKVSFWKINDPSPELLWSQEGPCPSLHNPGRLCEGWPRAAPLNVAHPHPAARVSLSGPVTSSPPCHHQTTGRKEKMPVRGRGRDPPPSCLLDDPLQRMWPLGACFLLRKVGAATETHIMESF